MNDQLRTFLSLFAGLHRRWRLGLILRGVLRAAAAVLALGILAGFWDRLTPFSDGARPVVHHAILILGAAVLLVEIVRAIAFGKLHAAAQADAAISPDRRAIRGALDLSATEPAEGMSGFLHNRALAEGAESLRQLRFPHNGPWKLLQRAALILLGIGAVLALLFILDGPAARVIALRLLQPNSDHPPYSQLVFALDPPKMSVIYGAGAEAQVTITGPHAPGPVRFITREAPRKPYQQAAAYALGASRYGQKLDRVVQPVEFAFAAGSARSHWIPVEIIRQPRIESVQVRLTPPSYSGLPAREFTLGAGDLAGLPGTQVELRVTSNRPLSSGEARVQPSQAFAPNSTPLTADVNLAGPHELLFKWMLTFPGRTSVEIRDVAGTRAAAPLEVEQKLLVDRPPDVSLGSPAGLVLATPDSTVPLDLQVEDDFGLGRVDLVRRLGGYRDRVLPLTDDAVQKGYEHLAKLDLKRIGVEAGQTLEFYAEAHDHNPSLMGIGSSEVGQIQIISKEEYAELVRARTTLAEFEGRFSTLNDAMNAVREALKNLESAAKSGDPAKIEEAKQKLAAAIQQAQAVAEALKNDFVAYDMEKSLQKMAGEMSEMLGGIQDALSKAGQTSAEALAQEAAKALEELGGLAQNMDQLHKDAKDAATVGRVMEMAARLRALSDNQKALSVELGELAREIIRGELSNASKLQSFAKRQADNQAEWRTIMEELPKRVAQLPETYQQLKQDAEAFLHKAGESKVGDYMTEALAQAQKDRTPETHVNSQLASVALLALLNQEGNSFCESAQKSEPRFSIPQNLAETMKQLMEGICRGVGQKPGNQPGQKRGIGPGGQGGGGNSADGFAVAGDPLLQAPVFGPPRTQFGQPPSGRSGRGGKGGEGSAGGRSPTPDGEALKVEPNRGETKPRISLRDVPEAYRDATRRFFGDDNVSSSTTPSPTPPKPNP